MSSNTNVYHVPHLKLRNVVLIQPSTWKIYNPALTRSEDSNWREMPASSKQLKTSTNASTNSFKKTNLSRKFIPSSQECHTHTSLFKCIHINVISMKNPPEALSRSCTSSTWQINQSTHLFGVPYVVIPPWTRLQIQISDPLDVLRWSHHLPLGIANQLHHILSCGGENPCWPSKFQLSKANPTEPSPFACPLTCELSSFTSQKRHSEWTGSKEVSQKLTFWSPAMNSSGVTVPPRGFTVSRFQNQRGLFCFWKNSTSGLGTKTKVAWGRLITSRF